MASVTIYVEGGGGERRGLQQLRLAFREFLNEFAGSMPKVVACGGRDSAHDDFTTAVRTASDSFIVLLVDAEATVRGHSARQHLLSRDGWDLAEYPEDQIHMMVQAIEAWMIADRDALKRYFGDGFSENPLPDRRNPESIPKDDLKRALDRAGRDTKKQGYHEINDGTRILAELDPAIVRSRCPWCKRLFLVLSRETGVPLPDLA